MIGGSAAGPLRVNLSRRLRRREQEAETGGGRNSRRESLADWKERRES